MRNSFSFNQKIFLRFSIIHDLLPAAPFRFLIMTKICRSNLVSSRIPVLIIIAGQTLPYGLFYSCWFRIIWRRFLQPSLPSENIIYPSLAGKWSRAHLIPPFTVLLRIAWYKYNIVISDRFFLVRSMSCRVIMTILANIFSISWVWRPTFKVSTLKYRRKASWTITRHSKIRLWVWFKWVKKCRVFRHYRISGGAAILTFVHVK